MLRKGNKNRHPAYDFRQNPLIPDTRRCRILAPAARIWDIAPAALDMGYGEKIAITNQPSVGAALRRDPKLAAARRILRLAALDIGLTPWIWDMGWQNNPPPL